MTTGMMPMMVDMIFQEILVTVDTILVEILNWYYKTHEVWKLFLENCQISKFRETIIREIQT